MVNQKIVSVLRDLSNEYNHPQYFSSDPIIFPKHFAEQQLSGLASLQDIEISAILSAHLAWGRRELIVRDCKIMFDEMNWRPFDYIKGGKYRSEAISLHRTIKWSDIAQICHNLNLFYQKHDSLEELTATQIRSQIFGQATNPKAANKKIHMFRRWMVRNDGIVDLGIWKNTSPAGLIIPLDVHVHRSALDLGITTRKSADITTAMEITKYLLKAFPDDPCKGDFALFAFAATKKKKNG
jgi:hypothetical protein